VEKIMLRVLNGTLPIQELTYASNDLQYFGVLALDRGSNVLHEGPP